MRLVVPYTRLDPRTFRATWPWASFVYVGDSDVSYAELLVRLWEEGRAFCLVEHDVEPPRSFMDGFRSCTCPWACYPYQRALPGPHSSWDDRAGSWGPGVPLLTRSFGCTRFGAELLGDHPDLARRAAAMDMGGVEPGHWKRMDDAVGHLLALEGRQPHVLHPEARHHHWLERWHRCACGDPGCPPADDAGGRRPVAPWGTPVRCA